MKNFKAAAKIVQMPKARQHNSELECFTLGLIWQIGPCTPYQVRKQMLDSPSTQWSGSAGAIYPLIRRLARQGMVQSRIEATGHRKHELYSITARGKEALRRWIGPPFAEEAISVTYDPLRSRARFLGALSPRHRAQWFASALHVLDEVAQRMKRWEQLYAQDDRFLHLIARTGEIDMQARRRWLSDALKILQSIDAAQAGVAGEGLRRESASRATGQIG